MFIGLCWSSDKFVVELFFDDDNDRDESEEKHRTGYVDCLESVMKRKGRSEGVGDDLTY